MKVKASKTAHRLLNLYRQEHVIIGGWAAINPIFINDADTYVIEELKDMPTGKALIQHIENLRSGKTPMDSIEPELLPYGGMMTESVLTNVTLTGPEINELRHALDAFTPDQDGLRMISGLNAVNKFGDEWQSAIYSALSSDPVLLHKWEVVTKTYRAYQLWDNAAEIVSQPIDDRIRAEIQADMPEYETYLPMFGEAGTELLIKLRTFISSI